MAVSRIWELLARKYNHEISAEELSELELLLSQHSDAFQLNELLSDLHELPLRKMTADFEEAKSADAIALLIQQENQHAEPAPELSYPDHNINTRKRTKSILWAFAAASAIGAAMVFFFKEAEKPAAEPGTTVNEVVTNGGSKSTIHLPDGSSVILNTGSKITYNKDFGVDSRDIYLDGEAFFDIAKNEKVPLTVHAGNVDIKVKGTIFNVKAYTQDSTVEASLLQGVIEVFSKNDMERKILLRPNEKIVIGKTSTITSSQKDVRLPAAKVDVFSLAKIKPNPVDSSIAEIAWIQNKLAFYKEPFSSLAQKMERWYNVSIHFNDEKLGMLTFTGSFEKEDIVEALNALRQITAFDYTIENRKVLISKKK